MRQGRASHSGSGSTKVEPRSNIVSPGAVSQIGIKQGNHASDEGHTARHVSKPLYEGRGLSAPACKTTIHKKGSQQ